MLRGNLDFLALDSDVHSLAVTSSQQGEGKSVTACNLAVAAALAGRRVILIEGDLRRPHVQRYLGLRNDRGLATVITGRHKPMEALQPFDIAPTDEARAIVPGVGASGSPGLYVLTHGSSVPNPGEIVASQTFARLIDAYKVQADLVIVDTPALLAVGDAAAIARAVDGLVFVVDPARARRPALQAAAEQLRRLSTRLLGVVMVQQQGRSTSQSYGYGSGNGHYASPSTNGNGNGNGSRLRRRLKLGSPS